MAQEIILYDLPTRGAKPSCWSLNPWKARASLNYKQMAYRTEWVEYPDLKPRLSGLGVAPNDAPGAKFPYSSPAARMPDGSHVMDSLKIARELDRLQPEPALHVDSEYVQWALRLTGEIRSPLEETWMPRVPELLLPERSAEYFRETRARVLGAPLEEVAAREGTLEKGWKEAEPGMESLVQLLKENPEGPYVMGNTPSFADFVLAGLWAFWKKLDKGGDLFGRGMAFDPVIGLHFDACARYFERDD